MMANDSKLCNRCGGIIYVSNPGAHACISEDPDAVAPKETWSRISHDKRVESMEPPPSDATKPVAWRWRVISGEGITEPGNWTASTVHPGEMADRHYEIRPLVDAQPEDAQPDEVELLRQALTPGRDIPLVVEDCGCRWLGLWVLPCFEHIQLFVAQPEDAPSFLHACSFCGFTGVCSAHPQGREDPTCKTCFGEHARPKDAAPPKDKGEFPCGCRWWIDGVRCGNHVGHGGPLQGFEYSMRPEGAPDVEWLERLTCGLVEDMASSPIRRAEDAPEGPTVEQIAKILCPGYNHAQRGLRTPAETKPDLPCQRCLVWAVDVRDAFNRDVRDRLKVGTDG